MRASRGTCPGTDAGGLRWRGRRGSPTCWGYSDDLASSEAPAAREGIGHAEVARAIDRVHAEKRRLADDAALFALRVAVVVQLRHAMQRDAGAVERRADLGGTVERAVAFEEAARGPAAAHVALHGIAPVRFPFAAQIRGAEKVQLVIRARRLGAEVGE